MHGEAGHGQRLRLGHSNCPYSLGRAVLLLDAEGHQPGFLACYREQIEATRSRAKVGLKNDGPGGIERLLKLFDLGGIRTVESVEPGPKHLARRSIGNLDLRCAGAILWQRRIGLKSGGLGIAGG